MGLFTYACGSIKSVGFLFMSVFVSLQKKRQFYFRVLSVDAAFQQPCFDVPVKCFRFVNSCFQFVSSDQSIGL